MAKDSYSKDRKSLCGILVKAREDAKLTQQQVAESGILSQSELSKIENGQRKAEFIVIAKLAELYKKPIDFFKQKE